MGTLYQILKVVSIVAFLYYGLSVLFANAMEKEFTRYGMAGFRKLTGALEVAGSLGLIAGYFVPGLTVAASGGLSLLMAAGIVVRFRSGDSVPEALQAGGMLLVNLFIMVFAWRFAGY
ncbi:DoxX family protein [Mycolicibacterium sp.]|uniref:DoxX family protein n=1 Tax=Mycolicibacterium sp. TaxID=2320850 RepID=UPI0028AC3558|nr:DoxX family protein [Mycolicibacterium sp.]